ncbi:MAG: metallopeptidase TldD-related protein [Terriglobales bacterium]
MNFARRHVAVLGMGALLLASPARAQQDVVAKAMRDEMARSVAQLKWQEMPKPYFLAYRVDEFEEVVASASLGALTSSQARRARQFSLELRVGDYNLDNSNYFSFQGFSPYMSRMMQGAQQLPLDNDYREIRRQIWLATDAEYKKAVEDLAGKQAALQNRQRTEEVPDFSREEPATIEEPRTPETADRAALEKLAREVSSLFRKAPQVTLSSVDLRFNGQYTRYLNSEGAWFTRSRPIVYLQVKAETRAADGMPLDDSLEFFGRTVSDLPPAQQLKAAVEEMIARLKKVGEAPFLERYNGPVLFEDEAAAEVFAQAFAPGLGAVRAPLSDNPQFEVMYERMMSETGVSLMDKLGGRVLPDSMDLVDQPALEKFGDVRLPASYRVDDDGVPTREVHLIEKGMLKTLLMTRTPVHSLRRSSGSRRGWGPAPANLVLSSSKASSREELRAELLRRAKLRGSEFGIVVRRVHTGAAGLLGMARAMASARRGAPSAAMLEVYKLYSDGREELVRGAELSGVTSATFRDIVAAGNSPVVHSQIFLSLGGAIFSPGAMAAAQNPPITSYIVPALLFEEFTLKKSSGAFAGPPASPPPPMGE